MGAWTFGSVDALQSEGAGDAILKRKRNFDETIIVVDARIGDENRQCIGQDVRRGSEKGGKEGSAKGAARQTKMAKYYHEAMRSKGHAFRQIQEGNHRGCYDERGMAAFEKALSLQFDQTSR